MKIKDNGPSIMKIKDNGPSKVIHTRFKAAWPMYHEKVNLDQLSKVPWYKVSRILLKIIPKKSFFQHDFKVDLFPRNG